MNVIGDDDAPVERPPVTEQIEPELSDGEYEKSISNSENDEEELDKEVASMTKEDRQIGGEMEDPRDLGPKSILRKVSKYEKSKGDAGAQRVQALRSSISMNSQNQFQPGVGTPSPQIQQVARRGSMAQMSNSQISQQVTKGCYRSELGQKSIENIGNRTRDFSIHKIRTK